MKRKSFILIVVLLMIINSMTFVFPISKVHAVGIGIDVTGTTGWITVVPANDQYDYVGDQQTGSGSVSQDIVGDRNHPAFYVQYDGTSGEIAFRIRINADGFNNFAFVGVDADQNGGLDFFVGVYNPTANNGRIGIYNADPNESNTSPSTTGIINPAIIDYSPTADQNYSIMMASDSVFSGDSDYFITFKVPVLDINTVMNNVGRSITIDETTPLSYIIGTAAQDNSFNQDIGGIEGINLKDTTTWSDLGVFSPVVTVDGQSTGDSAAPTINTTTPADDATGVAVNTNLTIVFSENVTAISSKNIVLKKASDGSVVETFDVEGTNVTVNNATVTVNPTNDLAGDTEYYVEIDSGAFKDSSNNQFTGITGNTAWNFTTETVDTTAPTLIPTTPADDATGVAVTTNLIADFSENVTAVSGKYITIKKASDDSLVETFDVTGANVTVNNATVVTVNPTNDLAGGTDYYVEIEAGAFEDSSNNPFAGIADKTTWNFTTETVDTTAPTLIPTTPADDATGVAVTTNLIADFSENVIAVSGKYITIKKASDNSLVETFDVTGANVTVNNATVTVNPTNDLTGGTDYYVVIEAGAFEDSSNNPFAGIADKTTWNFTTETVDTTAPTLIPTTPADDATGVAVNTNLIADFSENVTAVSGKYITIKKASDDSVVETFDVAGTNVTVNNATVTVNPTNDLAGGTDYYVVIDSGAFKDSSNNLFTGITDITTWNFKTETVDTTAPTLIPTTPADDATGVAVNTNLIADFSENVTAVSAKYITIKKASDDSVVETFDVAGANVTVNNATVTVNPTKDLVGGTDYYVVIDSGAFEDSSNNPFAGIADKTTWNFTTETVDTTAPTLIPTTPADDATGVAVNTNLIADFSENVTAVSGEYITIKKASDDSVVETFDVTGVNVTVNNATVTVNPTKDLVGGTDYYVVIDSGAFEDSSNNPFAGIADKTTWNFTTAGTTAPTLIPTNPADNATGVAVTTNLIADFSENVTAVSGEYITIKKASDDSVVETFDVTGANVTVNNATVTVNPTNDLAGGTDYYVEIEAGAFEDSSNNPFAGIAEKTTWNFTTETISLPNSPGGKASSGSNSSLPEKKITININSNISTDDTEDNNSTNESITELIGSNVEMYAELISANGEKNTNLPEIKIDENGQFYVDDVPPGEYKMKLNVIAPSGEKLAGNIAILTVSDSGEVSVESELIDPFGTLTDPMTNQPLVNVKTTLYWSDTELNRSKGRDSNTMVDLPELPDFDPNKNHNPQVTTEEGRYGWMVFPEGDYYMIAEKDGYVVYDSRQDMRNEVLEGKSYIRDGIIHVGDTIVQYDFSLNPEVKESGKHEPYMIGYPDGKFHPSDYLTRVQFAVILTRILSLNTEEQIQEKPFDDVDKSYWAAKSIFAVKREQLMLGYPDGNFNPDGYISRAEMAFVLEKIMTPEQKQKQMEITLNDISSHWAKDSIISIVESGLFSGYNNGMFQPDKSITRAEAVTVINHFFGRNIWNISVDFQWPDVSQTHWAFKDIMEASNFHNYYFYSNGFESWKD